MTTPTTAINNLFRDFEHTAWRLEARRYYRSPTDGTAFEDFLAGRDPGSAWLSSWLDLMREQTSQGKRVERVRIVDEPPSDYQRFLMWGAQLNTAAGEDIRCLSRVRAEELKLPASDFWVIDSRRVVLLSFDEDDRPLAPTVVDDPATVVEHCAARDAAWHHAVPVARYGQSGT